MKKCGQRGQVTALISVGKFPALMPESIPSVFSRRLPNFSSLISTNSMTPSVRCKASTTNAVLEMRRAGELVECVFKPVILFLGPISGSHAPQDDLAVQHLGAFVRFDDDAAVREVDRKRFRFSEAAPGAGTHQRADEARGELPVVSGKGVILGTAVLPDCFERGLRVGLGGFALQARL